MQNQEHPCSFLISTYLAQFTSHDHVSAAEMLTDDDGDDDASVEVSEDDDEGGNNADIDDNVESAVKYSWTAA